MIKITGWGSECAESGRCWLCNSRQVDEPALALPMDEAGNRVDWNSEVYSPVCQACYDKYQELKVSEPGGGM